MPRAGTPLDTGDTLPTLSFDTVAHGRLTVPHAFGGRWGVFLAYRAQRSIAQASDAKLRLLERLLTQHRMDRALIFTSDNHTVYKISPSRGTEVLVEVLGKEFDGVLGCDYFSAYHKYMRDFGVVAEAGASEPSSQLPYVIFSTTSRY